MLTAPTAELSCVIYHLAINLWCCWWLSGLFSLWGREQLTPPSASQILIPLGTHTRKKLYILIGTNTRFHVFYTDRSASALNHCRYIKSLCMCNIYPALWHVHFVSAFFRWQILNLFIACCSAEKNNWDAVKPLIQAITLHKDAEKHLTMQKRTFSLS